MAAQNVQVGCELERFLVTEEDVSRAKMIAREYAQMGVNISWLDVLNLVALKSEVKDEVIDAYVAGLDRNAFRVIRPRYFIASPKSVTALNRPGYARVKYANGFVAYAEYEGKEGWARLLHDIHVVDVQKRRVVKLIRLGVDVDTARECLRVHGVDFIRYALGLTRAGFEALYWRALWLTDHMIEISAPGGGKTTSAMVLARFAEYEYYVEPPSLATLIYDGRSRTYGSIFHAWGLVLDEFDKYRAKDASKFRELYGVLLTGMEQCEWRRGVGGGGGVSRCVPVIMLGNWTTIPLVRGSARDKATQMLSQLLKVDATPLVERTAIVVLAPGLKPDVEWYEGKWLVPAVLRGLIEYLRSELANAKPAKDVSTNPRIARHVGRAKKLYDELLGYPISDQDIINGIEI